MRVRMANRGEITLSNTKAIGSRIDYILCSSDMKSWFSDSNIQEGLMVGSFFL